MPQKRHTVDQIVAKLRKADVEVCKALTRSNAASVAAGLMWIGMVVDEEGSEGWYAFMGSESEVLTRIASFPDKT